MADQTTNLDTIAASAAGKETIANALFDAGSPATIGGRHASTTSGLTWGYYGGMVNTGGSPIAWERIDNGTLLLTGNATNYVELDPSTGVVSKNTVGFTSGSCPLYIVTTNASVVTNYLDYRRVALATI